MSLTLSVMLSMVKSFSGGTSTCEGSMVDQRLRHEYDRCGSKDSLHPNNNYEGKRHKIIKDKHDD